MNSTATIESEVNKKKRRDTVIQKGLPSPDEKRPFVQRLFTSIAYRYDWFNRLASLGLDQLWRKQLIHRGGIRPGMLILDLCAGTGDLSLMCADGQSGFGMVVGADLNKAMLLIGKKKALDKGLEVQWLQTDAQKLPFPNGTFDRVIISFSTRNLTDLGEGLQEMVRVLQPGGQLLILETGRPKNPIVRIAYQAFLFTVVRVIGFVLTGRVWPFTYLARSVKGFITPEQFLIHLRACRTNAHYLPLSYGLASLYLAIKRHYYEYE